MNTTFTRKPSQLVQSFSERVEIRVMTPEFCRMLVGSGIDGDNGMNTHNRNRSQFVEDLYAEDMRLGYWRVTGQGVTVTKSGVLADGQTRVHAALKSGRSDIRMVVVWDAENDVLHKIDLVRRRSMRDILKLTTGSDEKDVPAAIRAITRAMSSGRRTVQSADEMLELVEYYSDAIKAVNPHLNSSKTFRYAAPAKGAFIYAAHNAPARIEDIIAFADDVRAGADLRAKSPALVLRNYLLVAGNLGESQSARSDKFYKCLSAIRAHLDGREQSLLRASRTFLDGWDAYRTAPKTAEVTA